MSAALLEHFDLLAGSVGGVAKLRELILSLAVRGRLVPQAPSDEPASELLKRIRAEKDRLIAEGKIKRDKPLAEIGNDEKPYKLPAGWAWARFGDYSHELCTGPFGSMIHKEDYVSGGVPLINPSHMIGGRIQPDLDVSLPRERAHTFAAYRLSEGDIVLARRGEVGRFALVTSEEDGWLCGTGSFFVKFSTDIDRAFLGLIFRSPDVRAHLQGESVGTTMVNLNQKILIEMPIGIPPLPEQSRIVAKVEELMALCDRLEAEQSHAVRVHGHWVETALDQLAESADANEFRRHWQHLAAHFDTLFTTPASIDRLDATLLQLAVRGKLVPQDPGDEPASELFKQIRAEKDRLIATGQLKRDKPLPPISDEEKPYALPEGWEWITIPELCQIGGGATPSKSVSRFWDGNIPWVSPKDMKVALIADAIDHVSNAALTETRLPLVPTNSLLVVVRGMILAHSFPVGITQTEVTINQDMKSLTPYIRALADYLALAMRGFKQDILALVDRSTHGTCKLESEKLFSYRFALPPLAEQSRIVAQVEKLLALTSDLKTRLTAAQTKQAHLRDALIAEVC